MVRFAQEEFLRPAETAWFGQAVQVSDEEIVVAVEETGSFWDEDWLGLRGLNESGNVLFYTVKSKARRS